MNRDNWKLVVFLIAAAAAGAFLAIASQAKANWDHSGLAPAQQPRSYSMSNKTVTRQTPGSASEVHVTLSEKGASVELYCSVACLFLTGASGGGAPVASASTGMDMAAGTTRLFALTTGENYVSVWATAGGTITVGEKNPVQ